ncbi:MAG: RHS repeat protein, partial [Paraglaciecola sp.]|nr:RHS repeat protein [Paraglaciecola sp.]
MIGWQKVIRRWANNNDFPTVHEDHYYAQQTTSAIKPPVWQYFDKLGRQVATVTQDINGDKIFSYGRYDQLGNVLATSRSSFGNSLLISDFAVTTYDKYDRPFKVKAIDGTTTSVQYDGNQITTTVSFDRNGQTINQKQTENRNAFGQSLKVLDNLNGEIEYGYDVLGNLETVTSFPNSNDETVITTTHNKMGRKVSMNDPSKGDWAYSYNALGELLTQADNAGQQTSNTYDPIGRQTKRVLGARTTDWTFNEHLLDTVEHTEPSESTKIQYHYDSYGRVKQVDSTLNEQVFTQRTTYDEHGRVFQQFDASGDSRGIRYHYRNGYVHQLQEARDGIDGVYYQRNNSMDAFGNVVHMSQGNGVQTSKDYDRNTGYLKSIVATTLNSDVIQDASYEFDGIGNLLSRQ